MTSKDSISNPSPDGFIYTFEDSLSFSSSESVSSETMEEESTPGLIKATGRLWNRGTLWVHEIG